MHADTHTPFTPAMLFTSAIISRICADEQRMATAGDGPCDLAEELLSVLYAIKENKDVT